VSYDLGLYIPEDGIFHSHVLENFKSKIKINYSILISLQLTLILSQINLILFSQSFDTFHSYSQNCAQIRSEFPFRFS
jgi:hypothetical protein